MNHRDNPADAFDEHQPRHVWSDQSTVPASLISHIFAQVELGQEQNEATCVDELVIALHHPTWSIRVAAVQALARLGERTPLERLQEALHDEHVSVRAAVVSAIGRLGGHTSIHMLAQSLHDSEWQVREKAVLALAALGTPSSIALLYTTLSDPDSTVRESVSYALQQLQAPVPLQQREVTSVVQTSPEKHASIPAKANSLKIFLTHLRSPFRREQRSAGATIVSKTALKTPNEDAIVSPISQRSSGRRQRTFTTGIALLVALALVLLWAIFVPLQHLPGTATGSFTVPAKPTTLPSPTPLSLGPAGTTLYTYQSPYLAVFSVSWSPDDKRVVATDNTVQSWDATTGQHVITYAKQMEGNVTSVSWSPNGMYIAGSGAQVQLWNALSGQSFGIYQPKSYPDSGGTGNDDVSDSAWSPDSKLIASAVNGQTYGSTVQVWDPQTRQLVFSVPGSPVGYIDEVRWSPDGKYLAFSATGSVQVYRVATRLRVGQYPGYNVLSWSQDSTKIASTDDEHCTFLIWDVATGATLASIQYRDPSLRPMFTSQAIAWSPDGNNIAVAAGTVTEWNLSTKNKVLDYPNDSLKPENYVLSLAWSHNGSMIASASEGAFGPGSIGVVGPGFVQVWVPATSRVTSPYTNSRFG